MAELTLGYNANVPNGPNDPEDDQPEMLINTQSINTWTSVDHIGYNILGGGLHKQVTMKNQAARAFPFANGGDGALYANIEKTQSWPHWQNTLGSISLISAITVNTASGHVTLPGGIFVQWGSQAGSSANTIPVGYLTTFTLAGVPNNAWYIGITPIRAATSPGSDFATVLVTGSSSPTGFTIGNIGSHAVAGWNWVAIGPWT